MAPFVPHSLDIAIPQPSSDWSSTWEDQFTPSIVAANDPQTLAFLSEASDEPAVPTSAVQQQSAMDRMGSSGHLKFVPKRKAFTSGLFLSVPNQKNKSGNNYEPSTVGLLPSTVSHQTSPHAPVPKTSTATAIVALPLQSETATMMTGSTIAAMSDKPGVHQVKALATTVGEDDSLIKISKQADAFPATKADSIMASLRAVLKLEYEDDVAFCSDDEAAVAFAVACAKEARSLAALFSHDHNCHPCTPYLVPPSLYPISSSVVWEWESRHVSLASVLPNRGPFTPPKPTAV